MFDFIHTLYNLCIQGHIIQKFLRSRGTMSWKSLRSLGIIFSWCFLLCFLDSLYFSSFQNWISLLSVLSILLWQNFIALFVIYLYIFSILIYEYLYIYIYLYCWLLFFSFSEFISLLHSSSCLYYLWNHWPFLQLTFCHVTHLNICEFSHGCIAILLRLCVALLFLCFFNFFRKMCLSIGLDVRSGFN